MASHEQATGEPATTDARPSLSGRAARTFSYRHTEPLPNLIEPDNSAVVNPWSWLETEE